MHRDSGREIPLGDPGSGIIPALPYRASLLTVSPGGSFSKLKLHLQKSTAVLT